ncbi:MAG: PAS domain S-box protein [Notoacmeibacter sp.]|nr:PAS domain S-box protein [Notoacmeibacter sp.]
MAFGGPGVRATAEPGRTRDDSADARSIAGRNDNRSERTTRHDDWYFDENGESVPMPGEAQKKEMPAKASQHQTEDATEADVPEFLETADIPSDDASSEAIAVTPDNTTSEERDALDDMAPVRFVWRTDAEGRFTALSQEFIDAMGPATDTVVGQIFRQVAERFGLDQDKEIEGLLSRRDTWSGRSVLWPMDGTDLAVPVDLAALPVYDRDRVFQGFRGFGVARLADATRREMSVAERGEHLDGPDESDNAPTAPSTDEDAEISGVSVLPGLEETDPFHGEAPALEIAQSPKRRTVDKIISLAEHREKPGERRLSPTERQAFQTIGETLKTADLETGGQEPSDHQPIPHKADDVASEVAGPAPVAPAINAWGLAPNRAQHHESAAADEDSDSALVMGGHDSETGDGADDSGLTDEAENTVSAPPQADTKDNDDNEDTMATAFVEGVSHRSRPAPEPLAHHQQPGEPVETPFKGGEDSIDEEPVILADIRAEEPAPDVDGTHLRQSELSGDVGEGGITQTGSAHHDVADLCDETPVSDSGNVGAAGPESEGFGIAEREVGAADADDGADRMQEPEIAENSSDPTNDRPEGLRFLAGDLSPSFLARLPVPLIVTRGDHIAYANSAFLDLSGHDSLAALEEAGGLDILFADTAEETGALQLLRQARGPALPVKTHMQSVPWHGSKALLLAFTPQSASTVDERHPAHPHGIIEPENAAAAAPGEAAPHVNAFLDDGTPEQLRATVNQLNTILDTATDGVVLIEIDGTVRALNRSAQALFGFESDDVSGKPFTHLFAVESQRAARDYLQGLADNGVASVLNDGREVIGREAKGRFIPLFMTIGRLPREGGFCAVMRDITQWKRAEDELTQARRQAETASVQKTEFLARVSHEIRTPLNAIIGFSELMIGERFGPVGNERYKDYLRDINRSGNHVLDLVNDLLDISKIEAGQQELSYEAVALNDALAEAVAIMQPQANRERVIIRSSFASGLPDVVADLRSIKQIALNLLSNAVKFTPPGGQVIVSTVYEPGGEVVMRVRDTGIGMTDADVEHALKPFKQLNTMRRTRGDGTGLGLPLTKAMVEANRAVFSINSKPGDGTMVQVTFPAPRVLADH